MTVAIPTYQRSEQLRRAVDSVLAQDYDAIEVIISDNASTDDTGLVCAGYVAADARVRYVRQAENVGPTPNFEHLRGLATGRYFLFVGDDDWIDRNYISTCVQWHERHADHALVSGRVRYHHRDGTSEPEPTTITVDLDDPCKRVLQYCRSVRANGVFYGVVPTATDRAAAPLRNVMGGDVVHVASLAYLGRVRTLDDTVIHRTVGGMTVNLANVAEKLGLGWFQANAPQIAIAWWIFQDIAIASPVYRELGWRRWILGIRAGGIVFVRFVPGAVLKFVRLVAGRARERMAGGDRAAIPGRAP